MTGLSRCGKRYQLLGDAITAADARTYKSGRPHVARTCAYCNGWHVGPKDNAPSRPDPFPPAVARLLDLRDEHCQRCGATGVRLERHHRRAKASGGSGARAHTQCACNGLKLCRGCHAWVHEHPAISRGKGWIVPQSAARPERTCVLRLRDQDQAGLSRDWWYPTCDGRWTLDEP